ncbi:hypothetical protein D9611_000467 [Ephemerocybe angulata]|uniref:Short-chain dehydrogenase n=1 Tax=Ephemerocybe angulata TaxID=980116 RepID=A0A8H5BLP8_9AGAR|nr:hypothetical protein D9611_000467 [Tulosesus angulatus]
MKRGLISVFADQFKTIPPVVTADLTGQTVVVTGSNTGLGFQAAKHFARMGPGKLILAVRSQQKGDAAAERIKSETGFKAVEVWLLDQSKFSSVIAFADRFQKEDVRLDILVANAAIIPTQYKTTEDGWEESLQVNDLSTSLLCLLLAPRLVETGKKYGTRPRIAIVSSSVHYWVEFDDSVYDAESSWQVLSTEKHFAEVLKTDQRYPETKLLNIFFAQSLADLLKDTPVVVDTLNPGYCYSELRTVFSGIQAVVDWIMERLLAWTTEQGSRQLVYGALGGSDKLDQINGAYLELHQVVEPSDHVIGYEGKKRRDKLWSDLVRELSKVDGRVAGIVKQYSS